MSEAEFSSSGHIDDSPLFADLDGSLIRTDLLIESLVSALKRRPWVIFQVPLWLAHGRNRLKFELASRAEIAPERLPYRDEVIEFLSSERKRGRKIILATASDERLATLVSNHLRHFDGLLASNLEVNLKGRRKLEAIQAFCREHELGPFAYLGDSRADLPIWLEAERCYLVEPSQGILDALGSKANTAVCFGKPRSKIVVLLKLLRPYQWVKNILVFLPIIMAHDVSLSGWFAAFIAFVAFSICASAVYIINDWSDVDDDRQHAKKRFRPFAAGTISLAWGPPLAAFLLVAAFGVGLLISPKFALVLGIYVCCTSLYTFWLKKKVMADVLGLACLYSLRIFAGAVATGHVVSKWLLAFSFFFFLMLAFAKRYSEVARSVDAWASVDKQSVDSEEERKSEKLVRGYLTSDLSLLETLGPTSGYIAVLVLILYIDSDAMKHGYQRDWPLWLISPVLVYWICRLWVHAKRRLLSEDPIIFAFRDWVSVLIGMIIAALWCIASLPSSPF
jgi:4-hydroxybenzoate polyprenyltransferase/phosphoserine phosphatase